MSRRWLIFFFFFQSTSEGFLTSNAHNINIANCLYGGNTFKKLHSQINLSDEPEFDFFFMHVFAAVTSAPPSDLSLF